MVFFNASYIYIYNRFDTVAYMEFGLDFNNCVIKRYLCILEPAILPLLLIQEVHKEVCGEINVH